MCQQCLSEKRICTPKDQIEIKSSKKLNAAAKSQSQSDRILRSKGTPCDFNVDDSIMNQLKSARKTITRFEAKLKSMETRLATAEHKACNCNCNGSTETTKRITIIEEIIMRGNKMNKSQFANNIFKYVDNEIQEKLNVIDQTLDSLAHIENSFSSYSTQEKRLSVVEESVRKIKQSADSCEALFDVNATYNLEIQKQIYDINHRLDSSFESRTNTLIKQQPISTSVDLSCDQQHHEEHQSKGAETQDTHTRRDNLFSYGQTADRVFVHSINPIAYTKHLMVVLNDTLIVDINSFISEFQQQFEMIIGKNIVSNIFITKQQISNGVIRQIHVIVSLHVPLDCKYIDGFKFPHNWYFFQYIRSRRSHHRRRHNRMMIQRKRHI